MGGVHHMRLPTMSGAGGALKMWQNYPPANQDSTRQVFGAFWMAMSFTVATAHRLTQLVLPLFRTGSPGNITISIQAMSGGDPDGTDLTNITIDGDAILTTTSAIYTFQMPGVDLAATQYAIVIRAPAGSAGNSISWDTDDSSPTYAGGNREDSSDSGASWTAQTGTDMIFEEWGLET